MKPFIWPQGYKSAASLTFDFDAETVWVGFDAENAKRPGVLSIGHYGARVGAPLILDALKRQDINATFFVVGQNAERYPHLVERMIAEGHEVAVHGYTHTPPQQLSRQQEDDELGKTIELLQGLGAKVSGYRSPSWDVSPHTLELLRNHGIKYSSQMMADIRPYRHPNADLVELPIQWLLDDWPFFAFGFGQMDKPIRGTADVLAVWHEELEAIQALGGHFILTMHPQVMGRPSRVRALESLAKHLRSQSDVWIARCDEVAAYATETLDKDDVVELRGAMI
ncbi:polysaccharide deacetylase family protein [Hoeflea sp.]|uniref:polysaccharide deacetylase family protein n=1 Tax=Hoeflea sp. TaxID=1940281 RepID=UPI003B52F00B